MGGLTDHVAPELVGFVLTLALSLLIGFEREEKRPADGRVHFGGVRTFPLIGMGGFLLVAAFPANPLPFGFGLLVLGALLAVSHWASTQNRDVGLTTEVAAVLTFALGAGAARGLYWISIATGVVAVMLLQEKQRLRGLVERVPHHEMSTLVRFLLLAGVILPVVPSASFTQFEINPFRIWLVVVAVSAVSYFSYLLQLRFKRGLILAGLLGGAYSSTVTTVALARQSRQGSRPGVNYAGAVIAATGMMYIRLWILVRLFAPALAGQLTALFWGLGLAAVATGVVLSLLRPDGDEHASNDQERTVINPLELTSAFTFAGLFLLLMVVTRLVAERFGGTGIMILAAVMGATDVDPFILGLTQYVGHGLELSTAALAIVVTVATNNLMKGIYAYAFGTRSTGIISLAVLSLFGGAGIVLFALS